MNNITNLADYRKIKDLEKSIIRLENKLNESTTIQETEVYKFIATELIRFKAKLKLAKLSKEY